MRVTEWHICDGSRPQGGQASDQANWWARPVPATTADRSEEGHAGAARSCASHAGSPTPRLVVLHPGAPQRHSQISCSDAGRTHAPVGARARRAGRASSKPEPASVAQLRQTTEVIGPTSSALPARVATFDRADHAEERKPDPRALPRPRPRRHRRPRTGPASARSGEGCHAYLARFASTHWNRRVTRPILAVLDGSKALRRAVLDVFDRPVIARCQLHKIRNVQDRPRAHSRCRGSANR